MFMGGDAGNQQRLFLPQVLLYGVLFVAGNLEFLGFRADHSGVLSEGMSRAQ
jgi:hypothetical protein